MRRTLYLGFGHDEEVSGTGAQAIVELLASRGVRLEFALTRAGGGAGDAARCHPSCGANRPGGEGLCQALKWP